MAMVIDIIVQIYLSGIHIRLTTCNQRFYLLFNLVLSIGLSEWKENHFSRSNAACKTWQNFNGVNKDSFTSIFQGYLIEYFGGIANLFYRAPTSRYAQLLSYRNVDFCISAGQFKKYSSLSDKLKPSKPYIFREKMAKHGPFLTKFDYSLAEYPDASNQMDTF